MDIDNQKEYWDKVAYQKEFTHPLDTYLLEKYFEKGNAILDYGCGYGRIVKQLIKQGFKNTIGFDSSSELIKRGSAESLPIFHVESFKELPVENNKLDAIILFAVLTCIPSNIGQKELIKYLYTKLKSKGILYISDYYLQKKSQEMKRYEYLNNDIQNYGVFTLNEGVTFRHHPKEWISELLKDFKIMEEKTIEVATMNGHKAKGFQIIAQK